MDARTLQAFINGQRVGELRDRNGIWAFSYDPHWLTTESSFALSPALPKQEDPIIDGSSLRPVQWYFDNLLPEEGARQLLAKDAHVDAEDAFGLLAFYGAESAGSITLTTGELSDAHGTVLLSDEHLQARIEKLPRVPLTHGAAKRMSLAGVQHKLAVVLRDEKIEEPIGSTPSTHILKPNHTDPDYPHSVINEYFVMRLAAAMRIDVPNVFRRYVPDPIYIVERFDRRIQKNTVERIHLIDACQALNLDRQFKYRGGSVDRLRDLADQCTVPAAARLKLFGWLILNVLIGNSDAHLKNLSFLVDARGIRPAPFYDLLAVGVYGSPTFQKEEWPDVPLAFPILGCHSFGEVDRKVLVQAGGALGIGVDTAERLIEDQVTRVADAAERMLGQIETENLKLSVARSNLAPAFAGELRCVRAITKVVIQDMVARLRSPRTA